MSVSTAYFERDGSINFKSKRAVMWRVLFSSSIAYQTNRIEIMRKIKLIVFKNTNEMQFILFIWFIFYNSTCFGRSPRPSSGVIFYKL